MSYTIFNTVARSHLEKYCDKSVSKIFGKFPGKHLCLISSLIKLRAKDFHFCSRISGIRVFLSVLRNFKEYPSCGATASRCFCKVMVVRKT